MRSAIGLIWLSLFWTLLCFVFYRDRELIIQASLPVWIASALVWGACRIAASSLRSGWRRRRSRTWKGKNAAKPRKRSR